MGLGDLIARLRIDSRQFDTSIRKSTTEIRNIQKQGKAINTGIAKVTGTITKMVPAIGAVTTASAAFARTIEVNQTLNDQWHRQIDGLKGALDSFFVSVSTFSFSNLIEGMKNAYADAKKLYDALDNLNTFSYFNEADMAELNTELQKQIQIVREAKMVDQNGNPLHTETEIINAQNKALEIQNNILSKTDAKYNEINQVMFNYEDIVMKGIGATREEAKTFLSTYGSTTKMKDAIKELDNQIKEAEKDTSSLSKYTIQYNGLMGQSVAANDTEVDAMKKKRAAMQQLVELYGDDSKNSQAYNTLRKQLAATYGEEIRIQGQVNRAISRSVQGNEEFKQSVKDTKEELKKRQELELKAIATYDRLLAVQNELRKQETFYFNITVNDNNSKEEVDKMRRELKERLEKFHIKPTFDIDSAPIEKIKSYVEFLQKQKIVLPVSAEIEKQPEFKVNTQDITNELTKACEKVTVEFNPDKSSLENIRSYFGALKLNPEITEDQFNEQVKLFKENLKQQFKDMNITPDINIDTASLEELGAYINEINGEEITIKLDGLTDEQIKILTDDMQFLQEQLIATSGDYYVRVNSNVTQAIRDFKNLGESVEIKDVEIIIEPIVDEEDAKREAEEVTKLMGYQIEVIEEAISSGKKYVEVLQEMSLSDKIKELDNFAYAANSIADAFGKIGDAIGGAAGDWTSFIGRAINEVAQLVSTYAQLAYMTGISSAMALPPPQNIAMATATIAALASIIASIPKFAEGGMVGGTSYTGDRILAGLNSGERVLTAKQNDKFENILESINGSFGGNVTFTIRGRDLQGTLDNNKNYNNTIKKQ